MSEADLNNEEEYVATGEDNAEEVEVIEEEDVAADKQKKLRAKLADCETEKREHLEELQRTKADFLNSKRRLEEEKLAQIARATQAQIADLFPLADSFAMAMKNEEAWNAVDDVWRQGIEGIYSQLQTIFKKHNITTIDPTGEQFDPNQHEAVGTTDTEDGESDSIVEVVQTGFKQNDTILRPAKVIISN